MSAAQIPVGFIARLDTRHFSFEAHGLTEEQANEAMGRTLTAHGTQCGLSADWWEEYADGFTTTPFLPGVGTRDGSPL